MQRHLVKREYSALQKGLPAMSSSSKDPDHRGLSQMTAAASHGHTNQLRHDNRKKLVQCYKRTAICLESQASQGRAQKSRRRHAQDCTEIRTYAISPMADQKQSAPQESHCALWRQGMLSVRIPPVHSMQPSILSPICQSQP